MTAHRRDEVRRLKSLVVVHSRVSVLTRCLLCHGVKLLIHFLFNQRDLVLLELSLARIRWSIRVEDIHSLEV